MPQHIMPIDCVSTNKKFWIHHFLLDGSERNWLPDDKKDILPNPVDRKQLYQNLPGFGGFLLTEN